MTAIKPILKYPGAKWSIADWIISYLPPHKHYVEPYFGSGAVFFNKPPAPHEVINDLPGDVINLFRVIRERGEELAALIEMTPWAREEYKLSYAACDDSLERARRFVIQRWQTHGSRAARQGAVSWSKTGKDDDLSRARVLTWRQVPPRLRAITDRLLNAEIEHKSAIDLIADYAASDILIYADPPYPLATRNERFYFCEMTDADHAALLDALDAHPGPVVLSGYHCALYDERLAHWHTVERKTQAEKGNTRTEVLWLNDAARPQQMRLL